MKVFLDKDVVCNPNFTNNEIATYCSLRSLMKQGQDNYGATVNQLLYYMTNRSDYTQFEKKSFLSGLKGLIDKNLISEEVAFGPQDRILNLSSLHIYNEAGKIFISIDISEMQSILNGCKTNKYSILRYFILLIGTFNPKIEVELANGGKASNIIGTMPIQYLKILTGLSESTIMNYNKQLEALNLIYISHARDFYHTTDGAIRSLPNIYSRYCHKVFANEFYKIQSANSNYVLCGGNSKKESNHKRRLAQRYNRIMANCNSYSIEDVQEVYDYVVASNETYQGLYNKTKYDPYKEKIRDLTKLEEILKSKTPI